MHLKLALSMHISKQSRYNHEKSHINTNRKVEHSHRLIRATSLESISLISAISFNLLSFPAIFV